MLVIVHCVSFLFIFSIIILYFFTNKYCVYNICITLNVHLLLITLTNHTTEYTHTYHTLDYTSYSRFSHTITHILSYINIYKHTYIRKHTKLALKIKNLTIITSLYNILQLKLCLFCKPYHTTTAISISTQNG